VHGRRLDAGRLAEKWEIKQREEDIAGDEAARL
jgi:hypothetical protein